MVRTSALSKSWPVAAVAVWAVACAAWLSVLWRYSGTPAEAGEPVAGWIEAAGVEAARDRPTLVMFVHPRCPCTRASMSELARLQRKREGRFETLVVLYEPAGGGAGWRETDLWNRAQALPATRAIADPGGRLASAAGARTSGTIGLYAPDGVVLFWGGVTSARGHEGDSLGVDAITGLLDGDGDARTRASVYGCPLLGSIACPSPAAGDVLCGATPDA